MKIVPDSKQSTSFYSPFSAVRSKGLIGFLLTIHGLSLDYVNTRV